MIQLKQLNKFYKDKHALTDIDFTIFDGEILGLIGPNGAGKTTLMRILAGIITCDSGKILKDNVEWIKRNKHDIGYLPEERGLYKNMRVGEQLLYLGLIRGMSYRNSKNAVIELLMKFNILDWYNLRTETLSKGMQQKIQFLGTIIHRPNLLILDEPFTGLDPVSSQEIGNLILELKEKGCTIIYSSHNMSSVEKYCDNIVLLKKGHIVANGPIHQIKEHYNENVYEIGIRKKSQKFIDGLSELGTILEIKDEDDATLLRLKMDNKKDLDNYIAHHIISIDMFKYNEVLPTMNDIFINLVKE
ncbi:MAG: ATP-binding cassette domain-containing protein [Prevotella sp.]|jgi:ABC-2 type transport system ATP-binding protein|nr:ATP-binding cassette domain-containing protein [Prevotella sp.]MCH4212594.1 ATP-binding cassette domain-containing protein [Prevotella sp.]MCH4241090.1 ATP-binding cassette domain-containing protein [Prevotella sp.]